MKCYVLSLKHIRKYNKSKYNEHINRKKYNIKM